MKNVVIRREISCKIKIVEIIATEINDTTPPLAQPVKTDDKHDGLIPGIALPEILKFVVRFRLIIFVLLGLFLGFDPVDYLDYLDYLHDLLTDPIKIIRYIGKLLKRFLRL